jgi:hypothetical protein
MKAAAMSDQTSARPQLDVAMAEWISRHSLRKTKPVTAGAVCAPMILLLHTLIEAVVGLLFIFYPQAGDLVPGFGTSEGPSYELLMKMYGLAALFLASLSLIGFVRRKETPIFLLITLVLSVYHYLMILVQTIYNPDQRAALLHFLLAIFMTAQYLGRRRENWSTVDKTPLN